MYTEKLEGAATAFKSRKESNLDIDPRDVFDIIDWSQPEQFNDAYLGKLLENKIVTPRDVTRERNRVRKITKIADTLGVNPSTPAAFVNAAAELSQITVDWKGSMRVAGEWTTIVDVRRLMRMHCVELGLEFDRSDIDDATEQMYADKMAERPVAIDASLRTRREFDWHTLARFFRTDDRMTSAVVIAILKKFIHSSRRKLAGKKVTWHLMPVLHGPQGCGKTYLMERMLAPITEAVSWSNFEQITDDRNIALWNSLVIVLDEMAKAAKADVETIKHVITAESLDRRPMRSNVTIPVQNRATMIGASNHRLDELIKDDTGNRRFVELIYNRPEDDGLIDTLDFAAMWASVQPDDPDPLEGYRDVIADLQSDYLVHGPVHDWLLNFNAADLTTIRSDGYYRTEELYEAFKAYRARVTPVVDYQARAMNAFASELRRVTEQHDLGMRKVHVRAGNRWEVAERLIEREEGVRARLFAIKAGR